MAMCAAIVCCPGGTTFKLRGKNNETRTIYQKYKANENTRKPNPKKKKNQTINKKSGKDPM
jgi:hypothetical protein